MRNSLFILGVVLVTVCVSVLADNSTNPKRRRCRCQKYLKEVNVEIDRKLKALEDRFTSLFTKQTNSTNESTKLAEIDTKVTSIDVGMNDTREALRRESYSLRRLQENLFSQEVTMEKLNENFKVLEGIVRNLSTVVEKMEHIMAADSYIGDRAPAKLETRPQVNPPNSDTETTLPRDCQEIYANGGMRYQGEYYFMVQPDGATSPFMVTCRKVNHAGWTVIQRRKDGTEDFYRTWNEYKHGFGKLEGEFWLGNDHIHDLSTQEKTMLRIEMTQWNGHQYVAEYDHFHIGDEQNNYSLRISGYKGTAGDSMTPYWRSHDGRAFSTKDRDNDDRFHDNCAEKYNGAWWFNNCFESHLNGKYYQNGSHNDYFIRNGIQWNTIHSYSSLMFVEMMIKPADDLKLPNDI